VLEALAAPERLEEWGEAGRRDVWSRYRAEAVLPQWVELYRTLGSGQRGRRIGRV